MSFRLVLLPSAETDIERIADWIIEHGDIEIALDYVARIRARIDRLEVFPNRGTERPEFGRGVRSISFEGRYLILYRVDEHRVLVARIIAGAQDLSDLTL